MEGYIPLLCFTLAVHLNGILVRSDSVAIPVFHQQQKLESSISNSRESHYQCDISNFSANAIWIELVQLRYSVSRGHERISSLKMIVNHDGQFHSQLKD